MMNKKLSNIIIIVILGVAVFSGLSLSSTFLNVDKSQITTQINPIWNLELSHIEVIDNNESAYDLSPIVDGKTIVITPYLEIGTSITYLVKVENNGSYDARLDYISVNSESNLYIDFDNIEEGEILEKNTSKTFKVIVYNLNEDIPISEVAIELKYNKQ